MVAGCRAIKKSVHLDDNQVFDLLQGTLTPEGLTRLHEHIGDCASCREIVAEVGRASSPVPVLEPPLPQAVGPDSQPSKIVIRDGRISRRKAVGALRPSAPVLAAGMLVADRYRLERRLGEGGSGVVWAATHTLMNREVALKFLKEAKPDAVKRFLREARITAGLHHPNIVAVHDVFLLPGTELPVMVMDRLLGESLAARLRSVSRLASGAAARLLLPVVEALKAAQAHGILHRDLKPANIFIESEYPPREAVR